MSDQQYAQGWRDGVEKAQEELVRQDQFSERTLRILDAVRDTQPEPSGQPATREQVNAAVGEVLFNASNYPRAAVPHIIGQDIGPLRAKVTDAVVAALGT
ncbi:hypothetical protein [Curtobacterium sp. ISL-83]|uniref:hypothetical protein n=1 Tax=Curtobacterium sp. ISL-83 TaxID=2819145 RepID=UPI001BEC0495|nr:hypothetical protein [Curtobacterium sp. ISL-83]MBT2502994.1 hypothetical protein [Curtobacterium sp. ISL-83]